MTIREAVENVVAAAALKGQITSDPQRLIEGVVRWIEQPNFSHTTRRLNSAGVIYIGYQAIGAYFLVDSHEVRIVHHDAQEVLLAANQADK